MTTTHRGEPSERRPLRLWPGVLAVSLQWLARFVVPTVAPEASVFGILGGLLGGLAVLVWWLFFSRAAWSERLGAIVVMGAALFLTPRILHESIATGAMGMLFPILAIPILSLALVAWAVASRRLSDGPRRATMVATLLLACAGFALFRTGGFTGNFDHDLHWRWQPTPEERLLAEAAAEPAVPSRPSTAVPADTPTDRFATEAGGTIAPLPQAPAADAPQERRAARTSDEPATRPSPAAATQVVAEWPGFRGPDRDGIVPGVRIDTDWVRSPPVELWRRPIGPGWSSFAVQGDLLYTQEQRGDEEIVASYKVTTGEPVWRHRDPVRFWESNGGAGPRATPTLSHGRVYSFGATGILNALDAHDGSLVWSHDVASDTGTQVPGWGFASSPLVIGDVVIVAAAGRLAAYDVATGNLRWLGPTGGWGYSSPHRVTIDGVTQVLLLNGGGATSVAPANGTVLWEYRGEGGNIVQPALAADGSILLAPIDSGAGGVGTRLIAIAHPADGWKVEERWRSIGLKPSFNDYVVHEGHVFGFDGGILASIDLEDGRRRWKGGRYGHGQLVLLPDQDVLLVLSEEGELALVSATPDQFTELARVPAIEGKTWNHPVLVGDTLLVRNGEEMAAFRLSLEAPAAR
jgi:outer membrane protein assembly factor BamB